MARTCEDELKIAVIGDVHLHWSAADTAWFDSSDYNLLLFVGDIGSYRHSETLRVARSIGELSKPAILVAGNHDGPSLVQQASEIFGQGHLSDWLDGGQQRRMEQLTTAFSGVQVAGYERCPLGSDIDLIVCRPHSMGGGRLHFAQALRTRYGVSSLAESKERLCSLVDGSSASRLVFTTVQRGSGRGAKTSGVATFGGTRGIREIPISLLRCAMLARWERKCRRWSQGTCTVDSREAASDAGCWSATSSSPGTSSGRRRGTATDTVGS